MKEFFLCVLVSLTFATIACLGSYGLFSFYNTSFNIATWSDFSRCLCCIVMAASTVFSGLFGIKLFADGY